MRKLDNWNVDKLVEASKIDSAIEVNMGGRIIQFTEPYRESLRGGRWSNEEEMLGHRAEMTKTLGFNIFNTKGEWYVCDVTDCRTQERRKGEHVDAFLCRTVESVGRAVPSIEEAIKIAVEYRQQK